MEAQDFEAFKEALRRQALGITARMAAERFNADHSDRLGSTIACACGRPAQHVSRSPKTFITLMGPMRLERAYYILPRLPPGKLSARPGSGHARHLAVTGHHPAGGHDGGRGQLRQGERVVGRLGRVEVETRQGERCAEALGREIARDECAVGGQTAPAPAPTMYLGAGWDRRAGPPNRGRRRPRSTPSARSRLRTVVRGDRGGKLCP